MENNRIRYDSRADGGRDMRCGRWRSAVLSEEALAGPEALDTAVTRPI